MSLKGHLWVEAAVENGESFIRGQRFSAPYHLSKPYRDGKNLCLQIAQVSGGILTGDRLTMDIQVQEGARLNISTPSATRVMTMPEGEARVEQVFRIGKDAWLEVWPESLMPHRDSALHQKTSIQLEEGGSLRYMEIIAPGRVAHGESLEWKQLHLQMHLQIGKTLVLRETLSLGPELWRRWALLTKNPAPWLGNLFLIRPAPWSQDELAGLRAVVPSNVLPGITQLTPGALFLRAIAGDGLSLRDYLEQIRKTIR
jgi:urease accessory protein